MKKTGLFFGSFNPIHNGHLMVASYMVEFTDLHELWFVVSPQNPLKERSSLLADNQRLHLVNLAIGADMRFRSSNIEFSLPKPSYTVHTLAYLAEKYPGRQFVIICGTDIFPTFHKWKNWEFLLSSYEFYVFPRQGSLEHELLSHPSVHVFEAPIIEVSSSFVRNALLQKKNMKHFLPDQVEKYISEMHFYAPKSRPSPASGEANP